MLTCGGSQIDPTARSRSRIWNSIRGGGGDVTVLDLSVLALLQCVFQLRAVRKHGFTQDAPTQSVRTDCTIAHVFLLVFAMVCC